MNRACASACALMLLAAATTTCGGKTSDVGSGPPDASSGDSTASDANAQVDGPVASCDAGAGCVCIDLATYDHSCQRSEDCIEVSPGPACPHRCQCGGAVINTSELARYQAAVASVPTDVCPCPPDGVPACVMGTCIVCGFGPNQPPGCPDGG